jgi:hypothetical protein
MPLSHQQSGGVQRTGIAGTGSGVVKIENIEGWVFGFREQDDAKKDARKGLPIYVAVEGSRVLSISNNSPTRVITIIMLDYYEKQDSSEGEFRKCKLKRD